MKRLTKQSLNELAQTMPTLSEQEQSFCIGGDIIIMDQMGNVLSTTPSDENKILVKTPNGAQTGIWIDIPTGMEAGSYDYNMGSDGTGTGVAFRGQGSSFADEENFFKQLSRATDVEWALASSRENGNGVVFSSNMQTGVFIDAAYSGGYDTLYHNHRTRVGDYDYEEVSPSDREVMDNIRNKHGYKDYVNFGIYIEEDDSYVEY